VIPGSGVWIRVPGSWQRCAIYFMAQILEAQFNPRPGVAKSGWENSSRIVSTINETKGCFASLLSMLMVVLVEGSALINISGEH
jgi:hypothetical protein